ncbi:Carbonic anhydrase [Lachnellula hyalina]|uniref:Carbonic anhydrase n=1 Tax=Lachnellula hyalina TaxID=1316788 RepID=A0A8H8R094_9HELO|nr:Carbonic anhydrase [Lachnellula hyalina]TVY25311.1 Carbonic anhydrase [Lachnellula hyalina]
MPFDFDAVIHKQYDIVPLDRDFIPSKQVAKPHILWVGCSDSLTLETFTLDVLQDEIFVHRNLGNILSNGDLSSESAVAWAVDLLKVEHIVVCGHYGCGLTKSNDPKALYGWSKDIARLHKMNEEFLGEVKDKSDERSHEHRLEEIYTLAEAGWLRRQPNVKEAIRERGLQIHAFVYDRETNSAVRLVEIDEKRET